MENYYSKRRLEIQDMYLEDVNNDELIDAINNGLKITKEMIKNAKVIVAIDRWRLFSHYEDAHKMRIKKMTHSLVGSMLDEYLIDKPVLSFEVSFDETGGQRFTKIYLNSDITNVRDEGDSFRIVVNLEDLLYVACDLRCGPINGVVFYTDLGFKVIRLNDIINKFYKDDIEFMTTKVGAYEVYNSFSANEKAKKRDIRMDIVKHYIDYSEEDFYSFMEKKYDANDPCLIYDLFVSSIKMLKDKMDKSNKNI